ncbi:MAG: 2-C-methyl-D-erythritol 2,4-cyclodiphosphate synthase [Calditrichaeota bacterium]|nr:2-C-methyl-D-erythritol 2,4-cyclodiphosphate synthase [Calditrichota bacterium]MCB9391120.1 2-C-methyl-D-erythritol 2,4-cyclodiphosphate synthase [Calditrichota bacterium]
MHSSFVPFRIGIGVDAHRFVEGRPLVLGGVTIPFPFGLEAHSDGDVLSHAILDALLGAANAGDKGKLFPPSDPAYKGARSTDLLHKAAIEVIKMGYAIGNVDVSVVCEAPRISTYHIQMCEEIAAATGIEVHQVSIKGTTFEGLGFTGRKEGITAIATVLLMRQE